MQIKTDYVVCTAVSLQIMQGYSKLPANAKFKINVKLKRKKNQRKAELLKHFKTELFGIYI